MSALRTDEYEDLFRTEHGAILRVAFLITGDFEIAREVAQDAFAELFVHWRKVRRLERPGAWVRRVAIRKAVRARRRETPVAVPGGRAMTIEETAPIEALGAEVAEALAQLSPTQRAAVVLRYFQDLPVHEVADALGVKPSTASVHLHRARTRLGELLGGEVCDDVVG